MPARILRDERDRAAWVRFLSAQPLPLTVSAVKGAKRSKLQSNLFHDWVNQIAQETGQTQAEAKAECKLRFGKPIMERDRPDWVAKWQPLYAPVPYAMQLLLFEVIPVTSIMTTKQMAEIMNAIGKEYRAQGIALTDPEMMKYQGEFE